MTTRLIIFDMDGTLVDSETCAAHALKRAIPELACSVETLTDRFRGLKLQDIFETISTELDVALPADVVTRYRAHEDELATTHIRENPGVGDFLSHLLHPCCIASNAPAPKTRRSLKVSGLDRRFQGNIYSAYDLEAWKPDPRLFLHAAASEGFEPRHTLVVEDSDAGLIAAREAGMTTLFYNPFQRHSPVDGVVMFTSFDSLNEIIASLPTSH